MVPNTEDLIKQMENKPTQDLWEIVASPSDWTTEAILAAKKVLKTRGERSDSAIPIREFDSKDYSEFPYISLIAPEQRADVIKLPSRQLPSNFETDILRSQVWGILVALPLLLLFVIVFYFINAFGKNSETSWVLGGISAFIIIGYTYKQQQAKSLALRVLKYYEESIKKSTNLPIPVQTQLNIQAGLWSNSINTVDSINRSAKFLLDALKQTPNSREATILLAITFLKQKQEQKGIDVLSNLLDKQDPYLEICTAMALVSLHQYGKATRLLLQVTDTHPRLFNFNALDQYISESYKYLTKSNIGKSVVKYRTEVQQLSIDALSTVNRKGASEELCLVYDLELLRRRITSTRTNS